MMDTMSCVWFAGVLRSCLVLVVTYTQSVSQCGQDLKPCTVANFGIGTVHVITL